MLHLSKPLRYPVDDENLLIRFLPGNRPAGPTKTCRACGVLIGKGMYCDDCWVKTVGEKTAKANSNIPFGGIPRRHSE